MTRLVGLEIGGETQPWQAVGFSFDGDTTRVADVALRVVGGDPGMRGWVFAVDGHVGSDVHVVVDGIATTIVSAAPDVAASSKLGRHNVVGLDHVVVNTADPLRTCAAIESTLGLAVRRVREVGNGYEQRFHKAENMIIEVVSGPRIMPGNARLWGLVASVDDLDAVASDLGDDVVSPPKDAVQPGRRISTVRATAGLGVPFALMSPHHGGVDSPVV